MQAVKILSVALAVTAGSAHAGAFAPGEEAVYRIHYLGMSAGHARITVGEPTQKWGQEVWPIVTDASSSKAVFFFPVKDRFVTYWDHARERSIGSVLYANENRKQREQHIQFDHEAKSAYVLKRKQGEGTSESTHEIAEGTTDVAAATFQLRNHELEVGKRFEIPVFTGVKSFVLRAAVVSREWLNTPMGRREVFKLKAQTQFSGKLASKRDVYVYVTTDPSHVPVRIEAEFVLGSIVAELTRYSSGGELAKRD